MNFLRPNLGIYKNHTQFNWALLIPFLVLSINIFQIAYIPFINLAEGLGYDGVWYFDAANEFLPKTDNYHIFRLFPSTLVFFLKNWILTGHSYYETVKAFQIFNLICNFISFFLAYLIGKKIGFSILHQSLFFTFLFFNFHVLKDEVFNPVMTDTTVLFLSLFMLWSYLNKKIWLYSLSALMMLFTFPIGGLMLQIIYFLNYSKLEIKENVIPSAVIKRIFIGFAVLFLIFTSFIVYGLGRLTVLTFPDDINIYIFPLSIGLTSFLIFRIFQSHELLFQNLISLVLKPKTIFNVFFLIFVLDIFVYLVLPAFNKLPAKGFTGNFTLSPPLYLTLKPLIGFFDSIMFFGPVVILFYLGLSKHLKKYNSDISALLVSFLVFTFALKPEARHSLFLLPFVSILVVKSLPDTFWNYKNIFILIFVCFLFSKFWYPCHLSTFPPGYEIFTSKVNHKIFQEFPIQHYFMFQGPMISHTNYLVWTLIMIPLILYCYRILNPKKSESIL